MPDLHFFLIFQLSVVQHLQDPVTVSGVPIRHFRYYPGGFLEEETPSAAFLLAFGRMHVQCVIGDGRFDFPGFNRVDDPVDHLVAGAVLLALAQVAHRVDGVQLAFAHRVVAGAGHFIQALDQHRRHRLAEAYISPRK